MTADDAKSELETRLCALGFEFEHPDLSVAWVAFRQHLGQGLVGVRDYAMVEIGTYDFDFQPVRPAFVVDFCRQFGHFDSEGEFEGYEQLHLMLYFEAQPDLAGLKMSEFWEEGAPQDALYAAVECHPAFVKASELRCKAALLTQWEV